MTTILSLLQGLKKKTSVEFAGPCPWCGGNDRFVIRPTDGETGRWMCRQCSPHWDDGITLVRKLRGVGYNEACEYFGVVPKKYPFPARKSSFTKRLAASATAPCDMWRTAAATFLQNCQSNLRTNFDAMEALFDRYITIDTALSCGIGWHGFDEYLLAANWGVNGQNSIRIPRGIVIATRRKNEVVSLTIRRMEKDLPPHERFWQIKGGGRNLSFVIGKPGLPVFLCEAALDACLIWQNGQGHVACIATCGSTKSIDDEAKDFLQRAPLRIAVPDNDDAGRDAWLRWRRQFSDIVAFPAGGGCTDVTDMMRATCRQWPIPNSASSVDVWIKRALTYFEQRRHSK